MLENKEVTKSFLIDCKTRCDYVGEESWLRRSLEGTLYKIFINDDGAVLENKLSKLIKLYDKNIDFLTNPIATLSYNGAFVGYELEEEIDFRKWNDTYLSKDTTISYLKKLKNHLLELEDNDITYGDLKGDNILVDVATRRIKLCDVDNVAVDGLKADKLLAMLHLIDLEKNPDFHVHSYLHNLFTIEKLVGIDVYNPFTFLQCLHSKEKFYLQRELSSEGREVVKEMAKVRENPNNFSGKYLIDNLR